MKIKVNKQNFTDTECNEMVFPHYDLARERNNEFSLFFNCGTRPGMC